MNRPRWYSGPGSVATNDEKMPVQKPGPPRLPEEIAKLAYCEYARQGHGGQSYEEIHQRGGFCWEEIVRLLADALERERAGRPSDSYHVMITPGEGGALVGS